MPLWLPRNLVHAWLRAIEDNCSTLLLADAEVAEDVVQHVVRVDFADDGGKFVLCFADLHGDQFVAGLSLSGCDGSLETIHGLLQTVTASNGG